MKSILFASLVLLVCVSSIAQKKDLDLPAFGKVEKAELEMTSCSFDDKAEALVLVDNSELDYLWGEGFVQKRRVRIKILSDKGLEQANVRIHYASAKNDQAISGLEAVTYNLDGHGNVVATKLEKKLVYEKKLNKRFSEKVFSFPEVKVGSVIEYKYKKIGAGLIDWYFQTEIPVSYSRFSVNVPQEIEVNVTPFVSRDYEKKEKQTATRLEKVYSMRDVPAFRNEPYIINEDYYRDRLETKVIAWQENGLRKNRIANWVQVIKYLMEDEDFGVQIKKNIPRTADLEAALKTISDPYQRMKTVFSYVQKNMQWNELSGIWAFDGIKSAWKDKKGTAGEINLILVNLLKDAGLDVHPILVSTHDNGVVNEMDAGTFDWPGYHQFDKVMAYVELNGRVYVLDATDKYTPPHLIPANVLLTQGLVIEKLETGQWGWRTLWAEGCKSTNTIFVRGQISELGKMDGEVSISSFDYARLNKSATARLGKEKYTEKYLTTSNPGLTIDDLNFENLDNDSLPLVQHIKFNQNLNAAGEYHYFSTNILSGLENNPFVADSRFSDVFFGTNQSYTIMGNFTLPLEYELEALPKNIKMIMSDTSIVISRMSQLSGNVVMTRIQLEFKKPLFPATQYGELQEFYKQLQDLLNEQFVVRKKIKA